MTERTGQTRRGVLAGAAVGVAAHGLFSVGSQARTMEDVACAPGTQGIDPLATDLLPNESGSDQTGAFNKARDAIQNGAGGTLRFPPGTFALGAVLETRKVHLLGSGNTSSILKPVNSGSTIVQAVAPDPSWNAVSITDLGFDAAEEGSGRGLRLGGTQLTRHAEYVGRFLLQKLRFGNLRSAIERPFGNVGVDIVDCTFQGSEFHVWSRGQPVQSANNDPMHAGALTITRGAMHGARRASIYIDGKNVAGSGQVVLDSVRFENNPGWVLYIVDFNDRGPQPGVLCRTCWNETNYTARSVEIDGEAGPPGFAKLSNVPVCTFEDTPIGPLHLTNSHVITRGCNLDQLTSIITDRQSTVTHHDARMFTGTARGLVRSIGHLENTTARSSLNSPWFPMPPPAAWKPFGAMLVSSNGQQPEAWSGTTRPSVSVADAAIPGFQIVQELTIPAGATLISPTSFAVGPGQWLVVQFVARLRAGPAPQLYMTGAAGLGGVCRIGEAGWRTYTTVIQNDGGEIPAINFYVKSNTGNESVLRFAAYSITQWDSAQEALAFANSLLVAHR